MHEPFKIVASNSAKIRDGRSCRENHLKKCHCNDFDHEAMKKVMGIFCSYETGFSGRSSVQVR